MLQRRVHYKVARRYEIYLPVLRERVKYFSTGECFVDNYTGKGAIYYVTIATVTFSRAKITRFRVNAHLVFHWCLYARQE